MLADAHCQHVTAGAVQYAIGGRTHQQGQAVATMAANHDEICAQLFGGGVNFDFRSTTASA